MNATAEAAARDAERAAARCARLAQRAQRAGRAAARRGDRPTMERQAHFMVEWLITERIETVRARRLRRAGA